MRDLSSPFAISFVHVIFPPVQFLQMRSNQRHLEIWKSWTRFHIRKKNFKFNMPVMQFSKSNQQWPCSFLAYPEAKHPLLSPHFLASSSFYYKRKPGRVAENGCVANFPNSSYYILHISYIARPVLASGVSIIDDVIHQFLAKLQKQLLKCAAEKEFGPGKHKC